MGVSFGGQSALDPRFLQQRCVQLGLPCDWPGLPNQYSCPLGIQSGVGWLLLTREALDALDLNTLYPLVLTVQQEPNQVSNSVTLKNLLIVNAVCVTPGLRGDPSSAYLVQLADRRALCYAVPIDRAYNVPSTPGSSTYYSATLNAGSPWTWLQMVEDIWGTLSELGAFPGLPFTPDGTPEGFSFYGSYALVALGTVLNRLCCELKLDPLTDTFSIVRLGATDQTEAAALVQRDAIRVWDDEPLSSTRATIPGKVRVAFQKSLTVPDSTGGSPVHYVDQTDPTTGGPRTGTESNSAVLLFDDLLALYDATGTLTNSTALATRAAERAADYFRVVRMTSLRRVYGQPLGDAGLRPGSLIGSTRWGDRGRGMVQEIDNGPMLLIDNDKVTHPAGDGRGNDPAFADGGHWPRVKPGPYALPFLQGYPPSAEPGPWPGPRPARDYDILEPNAGITVCDANGNCISNVSSITLPPGFSLSNNGGGGVTISGATYVITNITIVNNFTYYTIQEVVLVNNQWVIINDVTYLAININFNIVVNIGTIVIVNGGNSTGGPGGTPILYINQCCSGQVISGSGSGSTASGCCLCGLEGINLTAQITSSACACLSNVLVTLSWVSCTQGWSGWAFTEGSCGGGDNVVCLSLSCEGDLNIGCGFSPGGGVAPACAMGPATVTSIECSPFLIQATNGSKFNCCTTGAGSVNITITTA